MSVHREPSSLEQDGECVYHESGKSPSRLVDLEKWTGMSTLSKGRFTLLVSAELPAWDEHIREPSGNSLRLSRAAARTPSAAGLIYGRKMTGMIVGVCPTLSLNALRE